jgi:hypothetical protein
MTSGIGPKISLASPPIIGGPHLMTGVIWDMDLSAPVLFLARFVDLAMLFADMFQV